MRLTPHSFTGKVILGLDAVGVRARPTGEAALSLACPTKRASRTDASRRRKERLQRSHGLCGHVTGSAAGNELGSRACV